MVLFFNVLYNADPTFSVGLHLQINNDTDLKFSFTNATLLTQCPEDKYWTLMEGLKSTWGK